MSLLGLGVVAIWHDLLPEAKDDFYAWHNREHMPERTDIPGFRRGRRYIATAGSPEYFNLYEADNAELLRGDRYQQRLNHPTPWTQRVVTSFRNVARGICQVLYSAGVGQGGTMLTLRFDVPDSLTETIAFALRLHLLPPLVDSKGITGVHLCRTDHAGSSVATAEKAVRNQTTNIPSWILLIEGVESTAVEAAANLVRPSLQTLGVEQFEQATYRFEYQRCKHPSGATSL